MPALKTCFKNLQYGVGNNIELAIEKVRQDFRIKGSVAMLDGRNAYNAISRTAILSAVYGNTHGAHCGGSHDSCWARKGWWGFYENGQLVHSWTSTRGVRQGMVLGPGLFSIGTIATLANWKAASPTPASRRTWTTLRWRHHRACLGRYARRHPERCVPWASRRTRTRRRSSIQTTSGHARGVHPAVCPRSRCGNSKRPRERADYAVCATQGEETDRLFRAIVELPFAKHTQWRLLSVSALPRVTFLLRTHAPVHTRAAAEWFDDRVTGVLGVIMDGPVTKRARDIAALPVRRGGCGLRRKGDCGVCYACLGEKGKQHALTDELDAKHQSDLYETLQGPDRKVFVSNTAAGAGRPLTDPQVHADDRGFSTYLRERLLVRVLPEGQKCVCGADASNEHVHTCTRLQQNPRTTRHDMINMTFANGLRLCGFQCGMEPRLTEASRRRPDILIVGLDTYAITDVTVTYAGRVTAYVSEESMEEADPLTRCTGPPHAKTTKVPSLGTGQRAGL
ncbi:putative SLACS reverse transcriptase [Trypanosoma cruzi]|uniref:Putative SLACS reverse transcriptase n=1 Tax=Trypanosoma cruzi TaxID=5693 RepID=A0A2V2UZA2_TRYCR|nr:putative SLACS reverse transcriptase [Trypanosoma cruzi]